VLLTAITMSSNLSKDVPLLEGSNYLLWADAMKSFLRSQGVWQIVEGNETQPIVPMATMGNSVAVKEAEAARLAWNNKDDSAARYMTMRISPSLCHLVASSNYSNQIWDTLALTFGVQGPALIYAEFKSALVIKIPAANPALEINRMATVFGHLATEKITIPQVVQGMLLLAVCLREYDAVSSTLLQNYSNMTLTFDIVRNALVADTQRRASVSRPQQQSAVANKISAVKRKGPNPNWQPKQSQQGESSGNKDNKGNSSCGKCAGKDKKKKEKKKEQQQHGHLASAAISTPYTTVTGSGVIIPPIPLIQRIANIPAMKDPHKQQPPQRFISASPSDLSSSVFPKYQQARDALDALDLAKTAHNLKPLEIQFTE
jgi:hypothetical protein